MRLGSILLLVVLVTGHARSAAAQCTTNQVVGPVVTHWSNTPSPGAPTWMATDQNQTLVQPPWGPWPYTWGPSYLPDDENYFATSYSKRHIDVGLPLDSPNLATAYGVLNKLSGLSNNMKYKLLNPTGTLQNNPGCVQIINGLQGNDGFYTVILPPNWVAGAPTGTYPIVFQAFYDVNENLFLGFGQAQQIATWIAESGTGGRSGAIGVIWNGGAADASVTTNANARVQFANIVNLVATNIGGDRHRIIMFGESRGAVAALMMASNPSPVYDYTVTYVVAANAGVKLGTTANLISATMPAQLGLGSIGFANAWQPGWVYPPPPMGRASLSGLPARNALSKILFGSSDFDEVDLNRSPHSTAFVDRLVTKGTRVVLSIGSHDSFVPSGLAIRYLWKLKNRGVKVEGHVIFRGGHVPLGGIFDKARQAMLAYVSGQPLPPLFSEVNASDYVRYYTINRATNAQQLIGNLSHYPRQPFTMEVPKLLYAGMTLRVMIAGEPGTLFSAGAWGADAQGVPFEAYTGQLPMSEARNFVWDIDVAGREDLTVNYWLAILHPGAPDWKWLDMSQVPADDLQAVRTYVRAGPVPNWTGAQMYDFLYKYDKPPNSPYSPNGICPIMDTFPAWLCVTPVPGLPWVTWGISEY